MAIFHSYVQLPEGTYVEIGVNRTLGETRASSLMNMSL